MSVPREPLSLDTLDLMDPAVQENWYPAYELLRDQAPVYRMPGTDMFVLTCYDDLLRVIRDTDTFANGSSDRSPLLQSSAAREIYNERGWPRVTPLSTNPPEHRRYRSLVDGWFNAAGAERVRSTIESTVETLIEEFADSGRVELVSQFALPVPVLVITMMLGFPTSDIEDLKRWSEAWVMPFARGLTDEQERYVAEQGVEFQHYIHSHIARKRSEPSDDVLSHLANASFSEGDGGTRPLRDNEIIGIIDHLYIGGNETTTFAITSALWLLVRTGLEERLRTDRSKVGQFVEEVLRLESPTQGLYRNNRLDVEFHGVTIPRGSTIHLRFAAANRDETVFPDAETLDLDRPNSARHLAFSTGEHHCPGAGLSRLEQVVALNGLLDRVEAISFAPGENDFGHQPGFVLRALKRLELRFTPRT